MPPRAAPTDAGRGRGSRGRGRGGDRGGFRGGGDRGSSRGRGDRGGWRGRGDRGAARGGAGHGRGAPPLGGPPLAVGDPVTPPLPVAHVQAIGVKRPGYGNAGQRMRLVSNHVGVELDQGTVHHYDDFPYDTRRSIARNYQIINALQEQVEGPLSTGVYDGQKNLFTPSDLELESDTRDYVVLMGTREVTVRLTHVASINPEVLQRFVRGEQNHDNSVLTAIMALNIVVRMEPSMDPTYTSNKNSFFTNQETRPIGGGIVLWRGYFQSVRPAIDRVLVNVDISTGAMYKPGSLINLALEFVDRPGRPNALAPRYGFPDRERLRLQHFISGIRITTPYRRKVPDQRRLVRKLTRESARDRRFEAGDGETMSVADYFQSMNIPLQYPDVICVELSTGAVIPLELCEVPAGQLVRKQIPQDKISSILDFSTKPPSERFDSIHNGLDVLRHEQSEYVQRFGMDISNNLVQLDARKIKAPTLRYNPKSRNPSIQPSNGTWNLIDKQMFRPVEVPNWVVLIYERQQRFRPQAAQQLITDFVRNCETVGITINPQPAILRWESGQGNISRQLREACEECQRKSRSLPALIVAILPEGANDIYTTIKHFGDVTAGIATQCMKAAKCFRARPQYYANITLKVNVKLGGTNVIPEPKDVSFLTDPANPTIVMGADITHAPPGSQDRPSYASLVGSVDGNGAKYVSRIGVQKSKQEIVEDMVDMCVHVFGQFRDAMGKFPKRILFYRDGVSESEFRAILEIELDDIRKACSILGFKATITLIIVGKDHKVVFIPTSPENADRKGNCLAGTVVDTGVVSPVEFDYYLYGHAGLLGTSKPAHYNVLVDENKFTADGLQSLSFALCHVYARCTRSVSIPAPVYYAHNVCSRAKNHYDPQQLQQLFNSDIVTETTTTNPTGAEGAADEFKRGFLQAHDRMARTMYFC